MAKKFPLEIVIAATDKASAVLNRLADRMDRFNAPFRRLSKSFSELMEKSGLARVGRALGSVGRSALELGKRTVIGVTAASAALGLFTYRQIQAADAIGDTAARLNISTKAFQAYAYGFAQADVDQEAFASSLDTLNKNLGLAKIGMGKGLPIFRGLGLDPKNFRTVDELLPALADRLSRIRDPAKRAAIANKLLGDAGAQMALKLGEGPKALKAMEEAAERAGAVLSDSAIEGAGQLDQRLKGLRATLAGVAGNALGRLYPALMKIADAVQAAIVRYQPQIEAFAAQFGERLPGYIDKTVAVFKSLVDIARDVGKAIVWCNEKFGTTATVVGVLASTIGIGLTTALAKLGAALLVLGLKFALAFPIATVIIAGVAAAVAAGWWLYNNWEKISDAIGGTIEQIGINFSLAWEGVKSTAVAAFEWIADQLKLIFEHSPAFAIFKGLQWLTNKAVGFATSAPSSSAPAIGGSLLQPGAGPRQQVEVKVDLSNLPAGTRASAKATDGIVFDLSRGWAMPGVP